MNARPFSPMAPVPALLLLALAGGRGASALDCEPLGPPTGLTAVYGTDYFGQTYPHVALRWTPPDVDLSGTADEGTRDLVNRLSTLTPQQVRVLMMLSEGLLNKQIAFELKVSEATVKAHVSAILQKLGVESRTQAVIAAAKIETGQWPRPAN